MKTIAIIVGKFTKSIVLRGEAGFRGTPRSEDGARKFFPSCGVGQGGNEVKQNHAR